MLFSHPMISIFLCVLHINENWYIWIPAFFKDNFSQYCKSWRFWLNVLKIYFRNGVQDHQASAAVQLVRAVHIRMLQVKKSTTNSALFCRVFADESIWAHKQYWNAHGYWSPWVLTDFAGATIASTCQLCVRGTFSSALGLLIVLLGSNQAVRIF